MRLRAVVLVPMLALSLAVQSMAAVGADAASPRGASSPVSDASPPSEPAAGQFDIWSKVPVSEWDEQLEESCIQSGNAACKMNAQQVHALPDDIKKLAQQLHDDILANPAEVDELKIDRDARSPINVGFKLANTVGKFARNPAVRNAASKYAEKIGDIADNVTRAVYAEGALEERTEVAVAKAVVSMVPVVGDVWSLGESIANGDVEGGVVAAVSLVGTVVGCAFPPAGAVVAVALAVYYVAKMIIGWFSVKERDWVLEPPGTQQELFESGADIKWETRKVKGKDIAVVIPPPTGKPATIEMTMLLDSKWTAYNKNRQPVRYLIASSPAALQVLAVQPTKAVLEIWQAGKLAATTTNFLMGPIGDGKLAARFDTNRKVWIGLGHPAAIKIRYTYVQVAHCARTTCTATKRNSYLDVLSEGSAGLRLELPYTAAFA